MPQSNWKPPNESPDDDTTVLLRLEDADCPIAEGFKEGLLWRYVCGAVIRTRIIGWMFIEDATRLLDGQPT